MRKVPWRRRIFLPIAVGIVAISLWFVVGRFPAPKPELSLSRVVDVHDVETLKSLDWRFPIDDTNDDKVVVTGVRNPSSRVLHFGYI
jgi:hypothetical protein